MRYAEHLGRRGTCVCPKCGVRVSHQPGLPCQEDRCPKCGAKMLREGSKHHALFLKKHRKRKDENGGESVSGTKTK
jgi:NAD-dependent SIR2 family protein deacetylase